MLICISHRICFYDKSYVVLFLGFFLGTKAKILIKQKHEIGVSSKAVPLSYLEYNFFQISRHLFPSVVISCRSWFHGRDVSSGSLAALILLCLRLCPIRLTSSENRAFLEGSCLKELVVVCWIMS